MIPECMLKTIKKKKKKSCKKKKAKPCSKKYDDRIERKKKSIVSELGKIIKKHKKLLDINLYLEAFFYTCSVADHINKLPAKQKAFVLAFKNKSGNVSEACEAVGIDRKTFYNWCKDDNKDFANVIDEVDQADLDFTESQLRKNVEAGLEASVFFKLKTKGKGRGFVERQEISGVQGKPIEFMFVEADGKNHLKKFIEG
jgi:hypothetical protein